MKKNRCFCGVFLLTFIFISCQSFAGVISFRMEIAQPVIGVGQVTQVNVLAKVDDPAGVAGNGLDAWQLDLSVDNTNVIAINETAGLADISLLAPDPDFGFSSWSTVNNPVTGEVREVFVVQNMIGEPSDVGIGEYTLLFSFNVIGLNPGVASYSVADDGGGFFAFLADNMWFENIAGADGGVIFDAEGSINTLTVVPEPVSISLFAAVGIGIISRRRKK